MRLLRFCFGLVVFQTISPTSNSDNPLTLAKFCDSTHLEQVEMYMNDVFLSSRDNSSSYPIEILSNNGTGYQCHCDFLGEFLECRIWTRTINTGCPWCAQQESVSTDRLPLMANSDDDTMTVSITTDDDDDIIVIPLWFEFCNYLGTNEEDRIRSPEGFGLFSCEQLRLSKVMDDGEEGIPTKLEDCSTAHPQFNCNICPDEMGTNITFLDSDGFETSWSSRCFDDRSTSSLLYQYHLNVQPFQVTRDDSSDDTIVDPCRQQSQVVNNNGDGDGVNSAIISVDEFCDAFSISSIEISFTESLEYFASLSSFMNVVDPYKCRCETTTDGGAIATTAIQELSTFQVVCEATYSDNRSGDPNAEPELYNAEHQMTMYKRKGSDFYMIKSVGSCDTYFSDCFEQELDFAGFDIVTCKERNNTVTAAFCELCPNEVWFADTVTPSFVDASFAQSWSCDEAPFRVNPTSYFLRYRGLKLQGSDLIKCTEAPVSSSEPTVPKRESTVAPSLSHGIASPIPSSSPISTPTSMAPTTDSSSCFSLSATEYLKYVLLMAVLIVP